MNYYLQKYTTHQFTYLIYYLFQDNFKNAKNYQNPTNELLSTKIHYTSIYIFYLLIFSRQFQKCNNYQNPTSTSKSYIQNNYYYFV